MNSEKLDLLDHAEERVLSGSPECKTVPHILSLYTVFHFAPFVSYQTP